MRDIYKDEQIVVPAGVTLAIKSRVINVEGPRGKLTKVGLLCRREKEESC